MISVDRLSANIAAPRQITFRHKAPLAVFSVVLITYLITLEPDLSWRFASSDGAELISASYTLGVPHPPGYPTFVIAGKFFSIVQLGTVAWRYNLFSALAATLAAAFTTMAASSLLSRSESKERNINWAVMMAGLTLAFVPIFWQQAIVAEVYALNVAVVAALLWTIIRDDSPRLVAARGFLLGLACTTHLTSLILVPMTLARTRQTNWLRLLGAFAIGSSPYLLLPLLASSGSHVVWGDPGTLTGFLKVISADIYRPNLFTVSGAEVATRLIEWRVVTLLVALSLLSAAVQSRQPDQPIARRRLRLLLSATLVAYLLTAVGYDSHDAAVLLVAALPLALVLLSPALARYPVLGLACLLLAFVSSMPQLRTAATTDLRSMTVQALSSIEADALLIVSDEQSTFALWYFQQVEAMRTDLTIINPDLFQFDWYRRTLAKARPELVGLDNDDLPKFLALNGQRRTLCRLSLLWPDGLKCSTTISLATGGTQ